jgi:hypothetical protein
MNYTIKRKVKAGKGGERLLFLSMLDREWMGGGAGVVSCVW